MRRLNMLVILTAIAVVTFSISAYGMSMLPTMMDTDNIKVGSWVKYMQTTNNHKMVMWIGAVGEQTINGKRYLWMEMRTTIKNKKMISKVLMRYSLTKHIIEVKRIIFKQDGKPAMELPPEMAAMAGSMITPVSPTKGKKAKIEDLGTQTITVPAGTFRAKHIKIIGEGYTEIWESNKVPFGIVKARSSGGETTTLLGYGSDAKTAITEKPQVLKIPVKMQ